MGCLLPSSPHCNNTAPSANPDASTSSSNCLSRSGFVRIGSLVILAFSVSNAVCWARPQCHVSSFLVRSFSGHATAEKPLMKER